MLTGSFSLSGGEARSSALVPWRPSMGAWERCLQSCADVALAGGLDLLCEDGANLLALLCEQHASDEAANAGVTRLPDGLELAEKSARLIYACICSV